MYINWHICIYWQLHKIILNDDRKLVYFSVHLYSLKIHKCSFRINLKHEIEFGIIRSIKFALNNSFINNIQYT